MDSTVTHHVTQTVEMESVVDITLFVHRALMTSGVSNVPHSAETATETRVIRPMAHAPTDVTTAITQRNAHLHANTLDAKHAI
jgi:hypothetical protein